MSLNPELGHLYHDSEINGEFIAIDAKERLRTREINAREQRHLDFQNNLLTRARDICERSRNWERWNIERQMRCMREKTPSLQHSLAQEASKLRRYERMMQEVYGSRSSPCQHTLDKQSQGGASSKKVVLKVPFANVSHGKLRKDGASQNGPGHSSSSFGSPSKDVSQASSLQSKSTKAAEDSNVTFQNSSFLGAGKDGTNFLSRNSVFITTGPRNEAEDERDGDEQTLRYGKDHYSPAAMLARPRNLRRRNERVVRSLLRLYHRVDDRKRENDRVHSEGGMSREAILEHALVVLRGTPDERMVERLLSELRFGASSPRRHMTDNFLHDSQAHSLTSGSSSPRRRNTEDGSDSQLRLQKFKRRLAESFVDSQRKASNSSASGDSQGRGEKHRGWALTSLYSRASGESPADDACLQSVVDECHDENREEFVTDEPASEEFRKTEVSTEEEEKSQEGGRDERESQSKTPSTLTKLPSIASRHE